MPGLSGSNLAGTSHERGGTLGGKRLPMQWKLDICALIRDVAICLCDTGANGEPLRRDQQQNDMLAHTSAMTRCCNPKDGVDARNDFHERRGCRLVPSAKRSDLEMDYRPCCPTWRMGAVAGYRNTRCIVGWVIKLPALSSSMSNRDGHHLLPDIDTI